MGPLGIEIIRRVAGGRVFRPACNPANERANTRALAKPLRGTWGLVTILSRHGFNIIQSSPTILISDLFRLSPHSFQALQDPKEGRSIGRREIAYHQVHSRRSRANCFGSSWIAAFSAGYLRNIISSSARSLGWQDEIDKSIRYRVQHFEPSESPIGTFTSSTLREHTYLVSTRATGNHEDPY